MIALTRSGYKKFIEGTLNIPNDTRVCVLSAGLGSGNFTTANVNIHRAQANSNDREFPFEDFSTVFDTVNDTFLIKGMVNLSSTDFFVGGDVDINQLGAVIDVTDSDDLVGVILLYPSANPITYSALNSNPVNLDYRVNGMAKIQLKTAYQTGFLNYRSGIASTDLNYSDTFPNSLNKLPIFDSTIASNMLTDMKIALLSAGESNETTFKSQLYNDSRTLSTLDDLDSLSRYHYISGGFTFRNLGIAGRHAALSATDSTLYIPGLTINDEKVFAVVYFEDTNTAGNDVMSDVYKQNSYILNNIANLDSGPRNIRFAFKQSVIINPFFDGSATVNSTYDRSGILAINDVVGPW
jgi:hypothetical protein